MSKESNELDLEKFIAYDESTGISKCLVPECHTILVGKQKLAIQRHYRVAHNVDIEEYENNEQMLNIHNANIHNGANIGESNPQINYNAKVKTKSNISQDTSEDKACKTFIVADYVAYCEDTNISKCLIKNCERGMAGRRTGNIKRHYDKVHNFIIVHEKIHAMNKELDLYYNDIFGDSAFDEDNEEEMSDVSEHNSSTSINLEQYIDYDALTNKSICKVPGCKASLQGRKDLSIKRHYGLVHNYDIESNGSKVYINSKHFKNCNGSFQSTCLIPPDDLVIYDVKSTSYHCLFINCNQILEKHLPTLKRHYYEMHKIIIARFSDNIPHGLYKKRKRDINKLFEIALSREDEEFVDESQSCLVKNEAISDDDYPHCSKRPNHAFQKTHSIKKEDAIEYIQPKSAKIEITMTKLAFLKLCLDLVIERDINMNLFDDEKLFKKLLVPFEQVFDCHVNSFLIESLMITANNIVMSGLKEIFTNRIVCLELHVVNYEEQFYLVFNVRFLDEQIIVNKVIGLLPITKAGTGVLPIFEYLSKFNIDKQQIYMTTIIAGLQDDGQIDEICNNLYPLCKNTLRTLRWEELINYKSKLNMDVLNDLRELDNYIENLAGMDIVDLKPQLKEAKPFLEALQILRNYLEKLNEEQYVAGDFYRDWLCCELELKGELTKNNNEYAAKLYEDFTEFKSTLLQSNELMAALYLDVRFNFLGSHLLSDAGKTRGKLFLCTAWEQFNKFMRSANNNVDLLVVNEDSNDGSNDDGYALLNQYVNDIMPIKSSVCIQDMITNCVPSRRKPFSLDILKYWHCKRQDMKDINELTKIAFTFSSSQYILTYLEKNFTFSYKDADKFDKFLIKNNQNMLEKNIDLLFEDLKSFL